MGFKTALIVSGKDGIWNKKVCGLFPLERNIRLLWHAGVTDIFLSLSEEEQALYQKKIEKKVLTLRGLEIKNGTVPASASDYLEIPSNYFIQYKNFSSPDTSFTHTKKKYFPKKSDDQFPLCSDADIFRAEKNAGNHIRLSAGGFIARNINKRISLPISFKLAALGVHPNAITVSNMVIGVASAALLFCDTYITTFIGGFLFQFASVYDGCDGEVAKLTCKFSAFGGKLDTINDYMTLILFAIGVSYLLGRHYSGPFVISTIAVFFIGIGIIISSFVYYLKHYTQSKSFVAYQREFFNNLPRTDYIVLLLDKTNYVLRKEFYSWTLFFAAVAGVLPLSIPIYAFIAFVGAICILTINIRYFPKIDQYINHSEMVYTCTREK